MDVVKDPIDFDKAIITLEEASKQGEEDLWDTMMNLGMAINQTISNKQFTLGDWACLVVKKYGLDTIGAAAKEIGARKKRLEEYRTVCSFFEKSARAEILAEFPQLTYSHLRLAAYKFESIYEAIGFLGECAVQGWSVEKSEIKLKKSRGETVSPEKFIDGHIEIVSIDPHTGLMIAKFIGGYCPQVNPGTRGRMTMHAATIPTPELAVPS